MLDRVTLTFFLLLLWSVSLNAQDAVSEQQEDKEGKSKPSISPRTSIGDEYKDKSMQVKQIGTEEVYRPARRISKKYFEGNTLIYDCVARHYACVDSVSLDRCKEDRELALREKKLKILPCAPLKEFKTFISCAKEQEKLQERRFNREFCVIKIDSAAN